MVYSARWSEIERSITLKKNCPAEERRSTKSFRINDDDDCVCRLCLTGFPTAHRCCVFRKIVASQQRTKQEALPVIFDRELYPHGDAVAWHDVDVLKKLPLEFAIQISTFPIYIKEICYEMCKTHVQFNQYYQLWIRGKHLPNSMTQHRRPREWMDHQIPTQTSQP